MFHRSRIERLRLGTIAVATAALLGSQNPAFALPQIVEATLAPVDGEFSDYNGHSVVLLPGWAFVASVYDDDIQSQSGAVYVYAEVGGNWLFHKKLKAVNPKPGQLMGSAMAATGDWMVATSPIEDIQGIYKAGSAQVFQRQGSTWVFRQKLFASNAATFSSEWFGTSATIDGTTMVIGEQHDNTKHVKAGAAYVFELQGQSWVETAQLYAPDFELNGLFGSAVALKGDTLVVGAAGQSNGWSFGQAGAAYVFQRVGGNWQAVQKLVASDPWVSTFSNSYFGFSVAFDGETIAIGAIGHWHYPSCGGSVYVFTEQNGTWVESQELNVCDPQGPLQFGSGLEVEGDYLLAGASADGEQSPFSGAGSAFLFRRAGGQWGQIAKIPAPASMTGGYFGWSVDLLAKRALIGAPAGSVCPLIPNCDTGLAYVFDLAPDAEQYCSCSATAPCGNTDLHGGCDNSTGNGAVLQACGSSSVASDSLVLETRWLPPDASGLLFMGGIDTFLPFGAGNMCVAAGSAGLFRFVPPQSSGPSGAMSWGPGLVASTLSNPPLGQIAAGQTWYFQTWYRDPSGPCTAAFNFSNALLVHFMP